MSDGYGIIPESQPRLDEPYNGVTFDRPIPTDLETVQLLLVEYLKLYVARVGGRLKGAAVEYFPDKPEEYRLVHHAAVLVVFNKAYPLQLLSADEISVRQEVEYVWDFPVIVRALGWSMGSLSGGGNPGAYQMLDELFLALSGLKLPGFTPLIWQDSRYVKRNPKGAVWYHQASFSHTTTRINVRQPDNFPRLEEIDYLPGGPTVVKEN